MPIHRENNQGFTKIPDGILKDQRLSLRAQGLLCRVLNLPDTWDFSEKGLAAICPHDGRTAIKTALQEIERAGYLRREKQPHGGGGKFCKAVYHFYDTPQPAQGQGSEPPMQATRAAQDEAAILEALRQADKRSRPPEPERKPEPPTIPEPEPIRQTRPKPEPWLTPRVQEWRAEQAETESYAEREKRKRDKYLAEQRAAFEAMHCK